MIADDVKLFKPVGTLSDCHAHSRALEQVPSEELLGSYEESMNENSVLIVDYEIDQR